MTTRHKHDKMSKKSNPRRNFIKLSALAFGSLAVLPAMAETKKREANLKSIPNDKKLNVVFVGAHPGDPEFGCGGTIAKYSDAGHAVTILYLTRGEASDPNISYEQMAKLRSSEAAESSKILNADPLFANQIDGNTVLDNSKNDEMQKMLQALNPDLVFTHWPLDSHPDHQIAGLLILTSWLRTGKKFDLYFYEVDTGGQTMAFSPTDYVDISTTHERKKKAMFLHQTQNPVETYETYFKPMEEFRGLEANTKVAEAFIHFAAKGKSGGIVGL